MKRDPGVADIADTNNLLTAAERPVRAILGLAWPVSLSMLFHASYGIVDMYWVSGLGTEAVAAVTLSGLIWWITFAVGQVFGTGVHALVARCCGSGQPEKARLVFRDGLGIAALAGGAMAVAVFLFAGDLLQIIGAAEDVAEIGVPYVRIMAIGGVVTTTFFTLGSGLRATGDMRTPLVLTAISTVLNILLDPILIYGAGPVPAFGLRGAAWASVIAMGVAFSIGMVLTGRLRAAITYRSTALPSLSGVWSTLTVGIPTGLLHALLSMIYISMVRMVAEYGSDAVAACGIGDRIAHLSFLPCMGIGTATATLVGQFLGARRPADLRRITRASLLLTFLLTLVVVGAFAWGAPLLIRPFTQDAAVRDLGAAYLRIFAIAFLFISISIVMTHIFQGAGDTVWPTGAAVVRLLAFLAAAPLLARVLGLGVYGIWVALLISAAVQTGLVACVYKMGTWTRKRLAFVEAVETEEPGLPLP